MDVTSALWYAAGLVLLLVGLQMLATPLSAAFRLLWHSIVGGFALWALNLVGGPFGLHLALNPVSAVVTGLLGLPGVGFLGVIHWLVS